MSGIEVWRDETSRNEAKNAVKHTGSLCFKCLIGRAVNRQTIVPLGTFDYIKVSGKICCPWFMVSAEQPERINDIICDVTHTGKQSVVCHNTSEKKTK